MARQAATSYRNSDIRVKDRVLSLYNWARVRVNSPPAPTAATATAATAVTKMTDTQTASETVNTTTAADVTVAATAATAGTVTATSQSEKDNAMVKTGEEIKRERASNEDFGQSTKEDLATYPTRKPT